jgi:hypothetical protein
MVNRIADHFRRKQVPGSGNGGEINPSVAWEAAERLLDSFEESVKKHPGEWLAAAFALGTLAAWWIKRR